jgi:hypothetical protein
MEAGKSGLNSRKEKGSLIPLSSAEVKNAWSYTATPPYVFMAWYLIKGFYYEHR